MTNDHTDDLEREQFKQEEAQKLREQCEAERRLDFVRVMETAEGMRVLRCILEMTRLYQLSYTPGDALATAFREGSRNVGLQLMATMGDADANLCDAVVRDLGKE